ncbi:MAG: radical SAM family heme chaperone HemW [Desulfobacterales bacterium]|nr:radical SAM family heme chaperone HemW [Desulfobacterales bacterium]
MSELLYIHVPFCLKKCRYCDFYSETGVGNIPGFVSALNKEIERRAAATHDGGAGQPQARTVYFGGGTPSLLPLKSIEGILETILNNYPLVTQPEITLEANPGTLDLAYLKGLKALGVNRLSMGIQSFRPEKLSALGRIHTSEEAEKAIDYARAAGFDNIGLDLIFGLPDESYADWLQDLTKATSFAPEHLSCYMLTLEPGTALFEAYEAGGFRPMSPDRQVDLFSLTSGYLTDAGFDHYEISNFAGAKSLRSRHNSGYWQMFSYDGFGPSAHSLRFKDGCKNTPERFWNLSDLKVYMTRLKEGHLPAADHERISPEQQLLEMLMIRLRTIEGVDIRAFNRISKVPFSDLFSSLIDALAREGFGRVTADGEAFALTRAGWARLDSIVEVFAGSL